MAIDYWPDEEGSIVDGLICGWCYADGAIGEGRLVKWGTSAAGRVAVAAVADSGEGCGVALKDASGAGAIIPVMFSGIVKLTAGETLVIGDLFTSLSSIYICTITAASVNIAGGTHSVMGCTMQAGADDDGDELLCLLGGDGMAMGLY